MTNRKLTLGTLVVLAGLAVFGIMTGCPEAGVAPSPTPLPSVQASITAGEIGNFFGIATYDVEFPADGQGTIGVRDAAGDALGDIVLTEFPDGSRRADLVGTNGVLASLHISIIDTENPDATQITRTLSAEGRSLTMYNKVPDERLLDPALVDQPVSDYVLTTPLASGASSPELGEVVFSSQGPLARLVVMENDQTLATEEEVNTWIDAVGLTPLMTNRAAEILMGALSDVDLGLGLDNAFTAAGLSEPADAKFTKTDQMLRAAKSAQQVCSTRDFWGVVAGAKVGACLATLALSPTGIGAVVAGIVCACAAVTVGVFVVFSVKCAYLKTISLTSDDCDAAPCATGPHYTLASSCTATAERKCYLLLSGPVREASGCKGENCFTMPPIVVNENVEITIEHFQVALSCNKNYSSCYTAEILPVEDCTGENCLTREIVPWQKTKLSADAFSCPCSCDLELCAAYCENLAFQSGQFLCGDTGCANGECSCNFAECGDGILTRSCPADSSLNEECDDGNTNNGDGCDQHCRFECGNAVLNLNEECEDGNRTNGDGCDEFCKLEAVCGDGLVDSTEQCDDGNTASGDGCSRECEEQSGYRCTGAPSRCRTICGDGLIRGNEECDPPDGECCTSNCRIHAECE
jgi:cysteine-rich repeat protein